MSKEIKTYESFDDLFNDPDFHFPFCVKSKPIRTTSPVTYQKSNEYELIKLLKKISNKNYLVRKQKLTKNRRIKISKKLKQKLIR
jgi:hypothetical protein